MIRQQWWLAASLAVLAIQAPAAQGPSTAKSLADVQSLKCAFTLLSTGTWDKGVAAAQITPVDVKMQFGEIDAQEGTANVTDVSTSSAGTPHVTVRLLGDNLHFVAMNISGSVYLTSVFADRESRESGKFKAVHTRHEFTQIRLSGWTSRPEQYYGQCEAAK